MSKYKLTYFDGRGRVEVSRLMFALADVEFEDVRMDFTKWADMKASSNAPLGQLPILEVTGHDALPQSRAIQRHLAREFGVYGNNNQEAAKIDVVCECIDEFFEAQTKFVFYEKDETKKAELKKTFKEGSASRLLSYLDKLLIENPAGYFVGQDPSLADLAMFNCIDVGQDMTGEELFTKYPNLLEHKERVAKTPKIAAYLAKRPKCMY